METENKSFLAFLVHAFLAILLKKMKYMWQITADSIFPHYIPTMFKQPSRTLLSQFRIPDAKWSKLQEIQYNNSKLLGLPDKRTDCAINSLAFIGAMGRQDAEQVAEMLNETSSGLYPIQVANYLECKDGYEKPPHGVFQIEALNDVLTTYAELKENCASLIGITRRDTTGHAAAVVRVGGQLMVFDPQLEVITPSINEWFIKENVVNVSAIMKLNKRSHCREETNIGVAVKSEEVQKCWRTEERVPQWKTWAIRRRRERCERRRVAEHEEIMSHLGFRLDL